MHILILGINGFIGSNLTKAILQNTSWQVHGMDLDNNKIQEHLSHDRLHFQEGDIQINTQWVDYHIRKCDVILPLVAIANPAIYVSNPLRVFDLDFEANLRIIRQCVAYKKRLIFPSTSEIYGMSTAERFDEEETPCVLGPIHKQRWIYSCAKQMLDRVIYAHGIHDDLDYTIFRPFNWLGPKMDDIHAQKEKSSRAVIQFISNILYKRPIKLIDGGEQRRCFTYIQDGIDALMRIIRNADGQASKRIFNVGNPHNNLSIKEVVSLLRDVFMTYPDYKQHAEHAEVISVPSQDHFGTHYEDVQARVPSIDRAKTYLGWEPKASMKEILKATLDHYLLSEA